MHTQSSRPSILETADWLRKVPERLQAQSSHTLFQACLSLSGGHPTLDTPGLQCHKMIQALVLDWPLMPLSMAPIKGKSWSMESTKETSLEDEPSKISRQSSM